MNKTLTRGWHFFLIADYYLAALLLIAAGYLKINSPGVGEVLEAFWKLKLLSADQILTIARAQPGLKYPLAS